MSTKSKALFALSSLLLISLIGVVVSVGGGFGFTAQALSVAFFFLFLVALIATAFNKWGMATSGASLFLAGVIIWLFDHSGRYNIQTNGVQHLDFLMWNSKISTVVALGVMALFVGIVVFIWKKIFR